MEIIYPKKHDVLNVSCKKAFNLIFIDILADGITIPFVYDTGAAISVISKTTAYKINAKMTDETISGGGNAGNSSIGKLAVIEQIKISSVVIKDLKAAVVPDEAMDFGKDDEGNDISINGFLGWDVIKHFKWQFNAKSGCFSIEKPASCDILPNMDDWDNMPIIHVDFNNEDMIFGFDTGNTESIIGKRLYPLYENEQESIDTFMGIDGIKEETVHVVHSFEFKVRNLAIELNNISAVNRDVFPSNNPRICGLLAADIIQNKNWILDYSGRNFEISD